MRLTVTVLIPPTDDEEFMSEITSSVDFIDPEGMSLDSVFKSQVSLKEKLEKYYNISLDLEYEENEVILILQESDDVDLLDLLENIRASLIKDLEVHGFKTTSFATLFLDVRIPPEYRNNTPVNKSLLN